MPPKCNILQETWSYCRRYSIPLEHSFFHYLFYLYVVKFFNAPTKGKYLNTSLWQYTTKLHEIQRMDILNLRYKIKTSF